MSDAFAEILGTAERAAAGSEVDKSALAQLLVGTDLPGLGGPENRAYLAVLLDWIGMREQAMLALSPGDGEQSDHSAGMPNLAAMLASGHGEYERAHELFLQALSGADDGTHLKTKILANLAALSLLAGKAGPASLWLARARSARGRAVDPATDVLLASTGFGIARAQGDLAGLREAVLRLNEATRARIAELGSDHPLALTAVASLAAAEFELASAQKSVESQERAIAVLEVVAHRLAADLGADHPQALACLENLFVADFSLSRANRSPDRASRAASTLESISQRTNAALGEDHPQAHAAAANAASAMLELGGAQPPLTRAPGDQPNFFTILGLPPNGPWDEAAYARALSEKRNLWSQQPQGIKTQDVTGEAQRNQEYLSAIERVMRDPQAREAERLAALRQDGDELHQGRTVIGDRLSNMPRTRTLRPMPDISSDSATRSLCHAVHLDDNLRDYVLHTVVNPHLRAVCPSFGVDLVAVARHAVAARRRNQTQRDAFIASRVIAILAIGLGILLRSPLIAIGLLILTMVAAWGVLAWNLHEAHRRAREAIISSSTPEDQASPLDADTEARLRDVERANVIVYAEGEGDPFIGSGRRLQHVNQVLRLSITRPAVDASGNKAVIKSFDVTTLHSYLTKEMLAMGLPDLAVKNRLYVRGDFVKQINGLLPDPYNSPRSRIKPDQVRSGALRPTACVRTYVCAERVREGGQFVIGMYARAELEQDLLSIERYLYFLPPIQDRYKPTRDLVANDFTSMTLALATAARRVLPMLMGKSPRGKQPWNFASEREKAEAKARRAIQQGHPYDYGARTSLREAVAAYFTSEHSDQADILREAQALDRRLLDLIKVFLDDHGVDTSDLSQNISQVIMAVTLAGTLQAGTAVVGGQGHLVTGHGAVNNFGSAQAGG